MPVWVASSAEADHQVLLHVNGISDNILLQFKDTDRGMRGVNFQDLTVCGSVWEKYVSAQEAICTVSGRKTRANHFTAAKTTFSFVYYLNESHHVFTSAGSAVVVFFLTCARQVQPITSLF